MFPTIDLNVRSSRELDFGLITAPRLKITLVKFTYHRQSPKIPSALFHYPLLRKNHRVRCHFVTRLISWAYARSKWTSTAIDLFITGRASLLYASNKSLISLCS